MRRPRVVALVALVGFIYFGLSQLGVALRLPPTNIAPFWPAAGLAGGVMVISHGRRRVLFGVAIFIGCFAGNIGANPFGLSVGFAVANVFEGVAFASAIALMRRRTNEDWLSNLGDLTRLCVGALVAASSAGVVGAIVVNTATGAPLLTVWRSWLISDTLGIVLVAPLVRALPSDLVRSRRWFGGMLLSAASLIFASTWIFWTDSAPSAYLLIPLLAVIALHRSTFELTLIGPLLATSAVFATDAGHGQFGLAGVDSASAVFEVQGFIGSIYVAFLAMAIVTQGRRRALAKADSVSSLAEHLFDNAPAAIALVDYRDGPTRGRYLLVSREMERLFGIPRHELTDAPVMLGSDVSHIHQLDGSVMKNNVAIGGEEEIDCADGHRTFHAVSIPLPDGNGEPWAVYTAYRDITEIVNARQELHRQEVSMRAIESARHHERLRGELLRSQQFDSIGRVAAGIAHDFNNLLGVMRNYTLVLGAEVSSDKGRASLERLTETADRGAQLTRQLLGFGGSGIGDPERIEVVELLRDALEMVQEPYAPSHIVTFDTLVDQAYVLMDREQLEHVVLNLVVNARDAMPVGGTINVRVCRHGEDQEWIDIVLADSGLGMTPEVLEKARQAFFTTKPPTEGSGMGLSIVERRVEAGGGSLLIESEVGKGTTVTVRLPSIDRADTTTLN